MYSRAAIERVAPHEEPHLIVSITSRMDDVARIPTNEHTLEIVRLVFLDVPGHLPVAMTDEDAERILDALERHRSVVERVVVHCDAGVSRSPGVALALAQLTGGSTDEIRERYRPNPHVVETLLRVAARRERERPA